MRLKILHCVRASYPCMTGNSIRTQYIVEMQRKWYDVFTLVSDYNRDRKQSVLGRQYVYNGIQYYICDKIYVANRHVFKKRPLSIFRAWYNINRFKDFITERCRAIKPHVIHGHSSFNTGLPALLAAKSVGAPFVYELRSITEYSRIANRVFNANSISIPWLRFWEKYVISHADMVICIDDAVRDCILAAGFTTEEKSISVPNGVDTSLFYPKKTNRVLRTKLNLDGCYTLGMVNPRYHEGIFFLIKSISEYFKNYPEDKLLIVGSGRNEKEEKEVKRMIISNAIDNHVIFAGKVPHAEMNEYYSIMDLILLPRLQTKENNIVTPLKPLEMMAAGKPILVSSVKGLACLVTEGLTGYIFKAEDSNDFIAKLINIRRNSKQAYEVGKEARKWIVKNRSWVKQVSKYRQIYKRIVIAE